MAIAWRAKKGVNWTTQKKSDKTSKIGNNCSRHDIAEKLLNWH
jgi:hypothetical protein